MKVEHLSEPAIFCFSIVLGIKIILISKFYEAVSFRHFVASQMMHQLLRKIFGGIYLLFLIFPQTSACFGYIEIYFQDLKKLIEKNFLAFQ